MTERLRRIQCPPRSLLQGEDLAGTLTVVGHSALGNTLQFFPRTILAWIQRVYLQVHGTLGARGGGNGAV